MNPQASKAKFEDAPLLLGYLIINTKFDKDETVFASNLKLFGMVETDFEIISTCWNLNLQQNCIFRWNVVSILKIRVDFETKWPI